MAKAVKKKAVKKTVPDPVAIPESLGITAIQAVLVKLQAFIEGPGTVESRQAIYSELAEAIEKISA